MAQEAFPELLWTGRPTASRGPKPALTVDQIAATAVTLADREGFDAVTLQRVAADLGFTKMSLYRYLDGKEDLVAVMVDLAVGEPIDLAPHAGWRARATAFCDAVAGHWEAHPWLPWATVGDRLMGPRETAWVQAGLTVFDDTGLTTRERFDATTMLFGHLRTTHSASGQGTLPWRTGEAAAAALRVAIATRPDEFALLARALDDAEHSPDHGRSFGLEVLLDGLEELVRQRAASD